MDGRGLCDGRQRRLSAVQAAGRERQPAKANAEAGGRAQTQARPLGRQRAVKTGRLQAPPPQVRVQRQMQARA